MNDVFVDRLGNVMLGSGVARLDFLRLDAVDSEKKQMTFKSSMLVVIPIEGLIQSMQMLEQMLQQLKTAQAGQGGMAARLDMANQETNTVANAKQ